MKRMKSYHIFCNGSVILEAECLHHEARGEEFADLTDEQAEKLRRLPLCCRWAAAQPEPNEFGCPEGHDFEAIEENDG